MSSLSDGSECDDAVKCGSARDGAALLRSLLYKYVFVYVRDRCGRTTWPVHIEVIYLGICDSRTYCLFFAAYGVRVNPNTE